MLRGLRCDRAAGPCVLHVERGAATGRPRARTPEDRGPPAEDRYPAVFLGRDDATRGHWIGAYGTRGYVLFSHGISPNNETVVHLPAGGPVADVRVHRDRIDAPSPLRFFNWAADEVGDAALDAPDGAGEPSLGAVGTSNPIACKQDVVVDVILAPGDHSNVSLSLYMADVGGRHRQQVVEVFDFDRVGTRVSPSRLVENFEHGVYDRWRYGRSVRFKLAYVRAVEGADAIVSALFFD